MKEYKLRDKKVYISMEQATRLYGKLMESASESHEMSHVLLNRFNRKSNSQKRP